MIETERKILEHGQKGNVSKLQECIGDLSSQNLISIIENKLHQINFVKLLSYILQGLTDTEESHKKGFQVVSFILEELNTSTLATIQSNSIIEQLWVEISKLKPEYLVDLCSFCTDCIQKGNVTQTSWKDLLPKLLNILVEKEHVEYLEDDITGLEYKTLLVNSLCMIKWSPNIITPLTSMFIDVPLSKEEHLQVVNKLGQYLEQLTCHEIPPFVFQLLKLCAKQNGRSLFLRLQHYFGQRVYAQIATPQNSESTNSDLIEDANNKDAIDAESTVLFHIYQSASPEPDCMIDYLSSLKNLLKSPEFILHPFQLSVLLTISTISFYQERVFNIVRLCISRSISEENKRNDSCWFRDMVSSTCKIKDVFSQIIEISSQERDIIMEGLVNLGFVLLDVGAPLGRDVLVEEQWYLGNFIFLNVIKKKRQTVPFIIQSIGNRIVTGQNVLPCLDFLNSLSKNMPLLMLDNQSCLIKLLECLIQDPGLIANQLLDAILPLIKISPTIRDHVVVLLRKALFSSSIETRQVAVSGFLKLLKNLKLCNLVALSQSSSSASSFSSGCSVMTQISLTCSGMKINNKFGNEALCLEVLGILRRCFMQQVEIKFQFYEGLCDVVYMNPDLGSPLLDLLWVHFSNFYVESEDDLPPMNFSKIVVTKGVDVILQEPLGKFIFVAGLLVTKVLQIDELSQDALRFSAALESLCKRMMACELIHFELDDGTDLLDIIPEVQKKVFILKEAISLYEALIGYKFCSWNVNSENNSQQINSLFQGYLRLVDFSKTVSKPKKGGKKKKIDDSTQQTENASVKKNASKAIKLSATVLNFQTIVKILDILHKNHETWKDKGNVIKTKREFHRYIMQVAINLVKNLKNNKASLSHNNKTFFDYCADIASIIFECCISRLNEFMEFDVITAILSMECFYQILSFIITYYKNHVVLFLSTVGGKSKNEKVTEHLKPIIEIYEKLLEDDEEEINDDVDGKKLSQIIVNTLALLTSLIPAESSPLSIQLLDWVKNFVTNNTMKNKQVATTLLTLLFNIQIKFKSSMALFENVAIHIGNTLGMINEETHDPVEFKLITSCTASNALQCLCNSVKSILDDADWIILRLRSEFLMITFPGEEATERRRECLKSKERGVCAQLFPVINTLITLNNVIVPTGPLSEALLKNISHLYNTLNSLTKYFILRSSKINLAFQGARFERVVKVAGKELSHVVYEFINYIEHNPQSSQNKKKSVDSDKLKNKIIRETRLIPKVVFEIEQFVKSVIQLSNKTKVDLAKFVGQGSARDFRIKGLKKVLEEMHKSHEDVEGDSETENMEVDGTDEEGDETDDAVPPAKKSKK